MVRAMPEHAERPEPSPGSVQGGSSWGDLMARAQGGDQAAYRQLDGLEGSDARHRRIVVGADFDPRVARCIETHRLESSRLRIHDPVVGDAASRIQLALADAVLRGVRGRQDLADPVGHDVDWAQVPRLRQALAAPAGEVGPNDVVGAETHVDPQQVPPAAGPAVSGVVVERATDEAP